MIDYYALAGFHCDAVEDRSLEEAADEPSRTTIKSYAVAPRRPKTKPLEIAGAKRMGGRDAAPSKAA